MSQAGAIGGGDSNIVQGTTGAIVGGLWNTVSTDAVSGGVGGGIRLAFRKSVFSKFCGRVQTPAITFLYG